MNSYERIVSYMYQYCAEEKKENVGYAKIERRGANCRIFVQVRARAQNKKQKIYLYIQKPEGIMPISMGMTTEINGGMCFKAVTEADNLFGSGERLETIDGVLIYEEDSAYYATIWKNDGFYLGNFRNREENKAAVAEKRDVLKPEPTEKPNILKPAPAKKADIPKAELAVEAAGSEVAEGEQEGKGEEEQKQIQQESQMQKSKMQELEMQSVCRVCPFKESGREYGKKILASYPQMMPFQTGDIASCVRMELQDIGCLPMKLWYLAGNRFVLQGYYSYRHLLFAQTRTGRYVLGVPGIYNGRNKKCSLESGFTMFQALDDRELSAGAFGYWLFELPDGNR